MPVTNVGNATLAGTVTVTVLLSADPKADPSDAAASAAVGFRLSLKPGQGKTLKLKFKYPTGLPDGPYYVLADAEARAKT